MPFCQTISKILSCRWSSGLRKLATNPFGKTWIFGRLYIPTPEKEALWNRSREWTNVGLYKNQLSRVFNSSCLRSHGHLFNSHYYDLQQVLFFKRSILCISNIDPKFSLFQGNYFILFLLTIGYCQESSTPDSWGLANFET